MKSIVQRFESKFSKVEGCWNWNAYIDKDGYGRFRIGNKQVRSNRASYLIYKGAIGENLVIRHKCDNPSCVNPDHLEIGTNFDNVMDMVCRNRQAKGEKIYKNRRSFKGQCSPKAKITEKQALSILSDERSHLTIAMEHGLTRAAVSNLKRGITWAHLRA